MIYMVTFDDGDQARVEAPADLEAACAYCCQLLGTNAFTFRPEPSKNLLTIEAEAFLAAGRKAVTS